MSDVWEGPGWWLGSDGKWHPPHQDDQDLQDPTEAHPRPPEEESGSVVPSPEDTSPVAGPAPIPALGNPRGIDEIAAPDPRVAPSVPAVDSLVSAVATPLSAGADHSPSDFTGDFAHAQRKPGRKPPKPWIMAGVAAVLVLALGGTALALQGGSSPARSNGAAGTTLPTQRGLTLPTSTTITTPTTVGIPAPDATTIPPPPAPTTGPLVTPQVESQVVATTWSAFAAAFAEDDPANLQATATPSVVQVVDGWLSCDCAPWPVAVTGVSYSAPPQTTYPLSFYAEIQGATYDGTPLDKEAVFSQSGPSSPWLVAYLGSFIEAEPLLGNTGADLQTAPPPVPSDITKVPQEFADFFQQLDTTGQAPALPAGFKSDGNLKEDIQESEQTYAARKKGKLADTFTHSIEQISPVFSSPYGDLVCATMTIGDVVTSTSGAPIVQPTNRSQWGNLLAPGSYTSVNEQLVHDECFLEQPGGSTIVTSEMGGPVSITGT
ncbi:MAG: hypothetical protein ABSC30_17930 [Acidimicrobiales bacterium]